MSLMVEIQWYTSKLDSDEGDERCNETERNEKRAQSAIRLEKGDFASMHQCGVEEKKNTQEKGTHTQIGVQCSKMRSRKKNTKKLRACYADMLMCIALHNGMSCLLYFTICILCHSKMMSSCDERILCEYQFSSVFRWAAHELPI